MSRHGVILGPCLAGVTPLKDFSRIPDGVSLDDLWQIVGPSVGRNIGRHPIWKVIAAAYFEGLSHGASIGARQE